MSAPQPVHQRILLKLSGEALMGDDAFGINQATIERMVAEVAEVWRRGSVVSSWLVDLTAAALARSPELEEYGGRVSDSGEGRWTVLAAVEEGVPTPVISAALTSRFASRGLDEVASKILSAQRAQFGGHDERSVERVNIFARHRALGVTDQCGDRHGGRDHRHLRADLRADHARCFQVRRPDAGLP